MSEKDPSQWWPDREDWPEFPPETLKCGDKEYSSRFFAEEATALMLLDEHIFISGRGGMMYSEGSTDPACLWLNVNDTFYYACADCEPVPQPEANPDSFWKLYDLIREFGGDGATAWCALQRQQRPLPQVEKWMKKNGSWIEELDELPKRKKC